MLRFLGVRHLAVIEQLEVEFAPGLNLLTGETGAGKSVLVEAIDLLLGARASSDLVRTGEDVATVQAVFERPDGREVIVRREISAQGRSRAFIDDALATTAALKELGAQLVDLHGQHEHQGLLDPSHHILHLDASLNAPELLSDTALAYEAWRTARIALERSQIDDREKRARVEMATFQIQEIDKVQPKDAEDEQLSTERRLLANVDKLARLTSEAYAGLYEGDAAALPTLAGVWKRIAELAALDPSFEGHLTQRDVVKAALDDLAFTLRSYASHLEASPDRLQAVEDRLAALERLKKRFGPTLDDVLRKRQALNEELAMLGATEEQAAALAAAEVAARSSFSRAASRLSATRSTGAERLSRALERALADVAMAKCRVDIRVHQLPEPEQWSASGIDQVEIFMSANPGEEVRPLARIASGGELSRVMLALRTLVATEDRSRTLVFDEVDAGIGGEAADAVGARLQALGARCQVLCITHLPQIAARAGAHYQIAKAVRNGRTMTTLTRLEDGAREMEIARMIAGASVSRQVLASARELLSTRGGSPREEKAPGESEDKSKGESHRTAKAKGKRGA